MHLINPIINYVQNIQGTTTFFFFKNWTRGTLHFNPLVILMKYMQIISRSYQVDFSITYDNKQIKCLYSLPFIKKILSKNGNKFCLSTCSYVLVSWSRYSKPAFFYEWPSVSQAIMSCSMPGPHATVFSRIILFP